MENLVSFNMKQTLIKELRTKNPSLDDALRICNDEREELGKSEMTLDQFVEGILSEWRLQDKSIKEIKTTLASNVRVNRNRIAKGIKDFSISEEGREKYEEWLDSDRFMVECPVLRCTIKKMSKVDLFKQELALRMSQLIDKQYNGNIKNFFIEVPEEVLTNPVISTAQQNMLIQKDTDNTYKTVEPYIVNGSVYQFTYPASVIDDLINEGFIKITDEGLVRIKDQTQMLLPIFQLVNNAKINDKGFKEFTIGELCTAIYGDIGRKNFSTNQLITASNVIKMMASMRVIKTEYDSNNNPIRDINIGIFPIVIGYYNTDGNDTPDTKNKYYTRFEVSSVEEPMQTKQGSLTMSKERYDRLDAVAAKAILPMIEMHRKYKTNELLAAKNVNIEFINLEYLMSVTCLLSEFRQHARIKASNDKKLADEIMNALDEIYKQGGSLLKYTQVKNGFRIILLPMTSEELIESESGTPAYSDSIDKEESEFLQKARKRLQKIVNEED